LAAQQDAEAAAAKNAKLALELAAARAEEEARKQQEVKELALQKRDRRLERRLRRVLESKPKIPTQVS
jgi:predicted component of type VI protein secretion system